MKGSKKLWKKKPSKRWGIQKKTLKNAKRRKDVFNTESMFF